MKENSEGRQSQNDDYMEYRIVTRSGKVIPDVRCRKIKSVSTAGRKTFRWNRCIGKATTTSSAVLIIVGLMGFFSDAEKLAENESAQKQQMVTDPITGLANSRGIMESMTSYLEELWRRNVNFVIMQVFVCEYEFFRKTCGEEAGDELLRRIGRVLEEIFGNNAVIGRITESQFFILMQYQKKGAAEEAADQINRKIQEIHEVGEWRPSCTAQVMFAYATADTISEKMYSEMIHKVMMELNEKEENDPEQESDRKAGK